MNAKKWVLIGVGAAAFEAIVAGLALTLGVTGGAAKQPTAAQATEIAKAYIGTKLATGASVAGITCKNATAGFTGPAADGSTEYYACIAVLTNASGQTLCTGSTFTLLPKGEPKNFQISQLDKSYCGG